MSIQPTIETERLRLRPFSLADAPEVQRLASDAEVARTTIRILHPYPPGAAAAWIATHAELFADDTEVTWAITRKEDDAVLGSVGLLPSAAHDHAEVGYWIGRPYWGNGYCTEAARAALRYAFETRGFHRVFAHFMKGNAASGRVLEKIGMKYEGEFPDHVRRDGKFFGIVHFGMLKRDFAPSDNG